MSGDKDCPARTYLIMSWKANQLLLLLSLSLQILLLLCQVTLGQCHPHPEMSSHLDGRTLAITGTHPPVLLLGG